MTPRLIKDPADFRVADGFSELVLYRSVDGRVHISIHDRGRPGYTASFSRSTACEIAAFLAEAE